MLRFCTIALAMLVMSSPLLAKEIQTSAGQVEIQKVVSGLDAPWAFGFLPSGDLLITERDDGELLYLKSDTRHKVRGLPKIAHVGQGGLLDLLIPRDFAQTRQVFMTYARPMRGGAATAVMRGTLSRDGKRLSDVKTIFTIANPSRVGRHFGSRLVEARDGTLFVTIGDRGDRPSAQDISNHNGTVLRITKDGAAAPSNPGFAQPEIWSYGHRNAQGAALDRSGQLWVVEHGARGGDEVNKITKGANYGWPVIAYGRHYSGAKIGEGRSKAGMQQPAFYWDPSIAPSGMMIYSGKLFKQWRGHMFIGSLKFDYISRLAGKPFGEREQIKDDTTSRVRDIREGPDGSIWFLSVGEGALYRMVPG